MSYRGSKKSGGFLGEVPKTPGSSRRKTHFFKENRGYGIIIGLCNRSILIEQIRDVPEDVTCKRCKEELKKRGML